jgi:hypothetical protein
MHPQGVQFFDESLQQSFNRGRIEGRAAEKVADVLDVLDARGLAVSDAQRERIVNCKDLDVLMRWHRRAVTVASVDELFE